MDEKQEIQSVGRELEQANYEYYVLDNPSMSDYDFDHKLRRLEELRVAEPAFDARANVWTFDTGNPHVLGVGRWYEGRKLVALFNFSGDFVTASAPEGGAFDELIYGGHYDDLGHVEPYPYGFVWLLQQEA